MTSPEWSVRRGQWLREEQSRTGRPARCAVCGTVDSLELHHLDYERLRCETHEDLVALCAVHHAYLHRVLDASRQWRRLPRRAASAGMIASMRRGLR